MPEDIKERAVSKSEKQRLRSEADASRERLVPTVGEFSTVARDTKNEAITTLKRYAPVAGGVAIGLALLKLTGGRGAGRRSRLAVAEGREQRLGDHAHRPARDLAGLPDPLEGLLLGEAVARHQDALRALQHLPRRERVGQ